MSIEIRNVSKNFGDFQALRDVSLHIDSGELVAHAVLQVHGQGRVGVGNRLVLAHQAAQLLGQGVGAGFELRIGAGMAGQQQGDEQNKDSHSCFNRGSMRSRISSAVRGPTCLKRMRP